MASAPMPARPRVPDPMRAPARLLVAATLALTGLAGCDVPVAVAPQAVTPPPPRARPVQPEPSALSRATHDYFAAIQNSLLMRGLLRTDRGGRDTPFNDRNLADNFVRIALFDEYTAQNGTFIARQTESRLRRWEQPVRMEVEFGASVPFAQQARDRAAVAAFAGELAQAANHPISVAANPNFHVLVLNEDERLGIAPRLRQLVPGIAESDISTIVNMQRSTFCLVFAFSDGRSSTYGKAVAVIRGEHPDLLRQSCFHEELAQGLGLANDSPAARPSIFNDDEEFALLTRQDALMLRILYDPRLKPGMTVATARPIVQTIAYELLGGES